MGVVRGSRCCGMVLVVSMAWGEFSTGGGGSTVGSCGVLDDLGMLPVRGGEHPGREARLARPPRLVSAGVVHRVWVIVCGWSPVWLL